MTIGRNRKIDIYFVLYLAALLFLLPDSEKKELGNKYESSLPILEQTFNLYLDKTTLICTAALDSNGINIISFDSINTIYYTGNVDNVRMEFTIQDQNLGLYSYVSDVNYKGKFFRIVESRNEKATYFYWNPTFDELTNKSYIVDVIAYAKENQTGNEVKARIKFSLNLLFIRDVISSQQLISIKESDTTLLNNLSSPTFESTARPVELLVASSIVESLAYENWSNQIFINGTISRDIEKILPLRILRNPENNGGTAEIIDLKGSTIILGGRTPFGGNMKVEFALIRKYDGQKISLEFTVSPRPIRQPEFANRMYPGAKYYIKPNLPILKGITTQAILKDGQNERVVSDGISEIEFVPELNDTGKTFVLERYINQTLRDKFNIFIQSIPEPKIIRLVSDSPGKVKLETRSFGYYKGKENLVQYLEIDGNAKYFQKFGTLPVSSNELEHSQFFEIVPKNVKEKFEFRVRCIDNYGKKSNFETYSEFK